MKYFKIFSVLLLIIVTFPINAFGAGSAILYGGTSYSSIRSQTEKIDYSGAANKLVWSIRVNRANNEFVNINSKVFLDDTIMVTSYNDVFKFDNNLVRLADSPNITVTPDATYKLLISMDGTNYIEESSPDWRQVRAFKVVLPSKVAVGTILEVGFPIEVDSVNLPTDLASKGIEHSYIYGSSGGRVGDWLPLYISPKIDEAQDVSVEYIDADGNPIHDKKIISGNIGEAYDASTDEYKLSIPNYTLDESQLPSNAIGIMSEDAQTVTYVYTKDLNPTPAEDVTIKYLDEDGNPVRESQKISGNIGDSYDASTPDYKVNVDGYTLDESQLPSNSTGKLSDTAQTVTYVYKNILLSTINEGKKNTQDTGKVIVRHTDTAGKQLVSNNVIAGKVGKNYSSQPLRTLPNTGIDNTISKVLKFVGLLILISLLALWEINRTKVRNKE